MTNSITSAFSNLNKDIYKILKINLSDNSYEIIKYQDVRLNSIDTRMDSIDKWFENFKNLGLVHPEDMTAFLSHTSINYLKSYFENSDENFHFKYRRKVNDEYRWVMMIISKSSEYTDSSRIVYLYIQDINKETLNSSKEDKQIHDLLKSEYINLSMIQRIMHIGILKINYDCFGNETSLEVSDELKDMLCIKNEDDAIKKSEDFFKLMNPQDAEAIKNAYAAAMKDPECSYVGNAEYRITDKNNKLRWFKSSGEIFRNHGIPHLAIIIYTDITEKKEYEQAVQKQIEHSDIIKSQFEILKSIASIYLTMHIVNIQEDTVYEFLANSIVKKYVNNAKNAQSQMNTTMHKTINSAYLAKALNFVDFSTLEQRMNNKKIISIELLGNNVGWIRAQFIKLAYNEKGLNSVIFTTQIINKEKQKEEDLLKVSYTDALTNMYNRRKYEEDCEKYKQTSLSDNFVIMQADVNGLKTVNDILGHHAGDELIMGAAECILASFSRYGTVYRTGGDEFTGFLNINAENLEQAKQNFEKKVSFWSGKLVTHMTISCGYAVKADNPDLSLFDLIKKADQLMYENKNEYYKKTGLNRRAH